MRRLLGRLTVVALFAGAFPARAATQVPVSAAPAADSGGSKRNVLPALEIVGFLTALNIVDRIFLGYEMEGGKRVFSSTFGTTWDHLRKQRWVHDADGFSVNQFGHPYQGAMMFGLARSSGHGFWTSLIHANVASFVWEIAGETVTPSVDDLITTAQAGSLFGEALYRIADLVLKAGPEKHHQLAEYAASVISPPGALNRRVFGDRFKARLPDTPPSTIWQVTLGATLDALARGVSSPRTLLRSDVTAEFAMSYGLPGQRDYNYTRPLDYFDFRIAFLANLKNPIENLMVRGLLVGAKTAGGEASQGIWGLYGSFDYASPTLYRISSTALSVGTTRQYRLPNGYVMEASALGGVGYGAAGSTTIIASTPTNAAVRDYHFGVTPQALVEFKFISGRWVMIDLSAREFYVSGLGSDDTHGSEAIYRGNAGITVRLAGGHAIGAHITSSARSARYGTLPTRNYSEQTLVVAYSILGGSGFSVVK